MQRDDKLTGRAGFTEGQYIIYHDKAIPDRYELGKIKRLSDSRAFVYYSSGDTAELTAYEHMHTINNFPVIGETNLGGCMA